MSGDPVPTVLQNRFQPALTMLPRDLGPAPATASGSTSRRQGSFWGDLVFNVPVKLLGDGLVKSNTETTPVPREMFLGESQSSADTERRVWKARFLVHKWN